MKQLQRSGQGSQVILLALSLLGVAIAIYLTSVHYENVPLVCSDSGLVNCTRVLSSPYSVIPGTSLPITIPGIVWGMMSAALAIFGLITTSGQRQRRIRIAQFAWSLLGLLTVLYLVYVEIVRLHSICAWCTALHVLILLMFLITSVQLQSLSDISDASSEIESEEAEILGTLPRSK
jgi:uncharacterized membrane protein